MEQIKEPETKVLTTEEFLARIKPGAKSLNVPELGGSVKIKALNVRERGEVKSGSTGHGGVMSDESFISITVLKGLVEPKLTPQNIADLILGNFGVMNKISKEIWRLSGVDDDVKNA